MFKDIKEVIKNSKKFKNLMFLSSAIVIFSGPLVYAMDLKDDDNLKNVSASAPSFSKVKRWTGQDGVTYESTDVMIQGTMQTITVPITDSNSSSSASTPQVERWTRHEEVTDVSVDVIIDGKVQTRSIPLPRSVALQIMNKEVEKKER